MRRQGATCLVPRLVAGLLGMAMVLSAMPAAADTTPYAESFEEGWGGWDRDHDAPCEEDPTPCVVDWAIDRNNAAAFHGVWSLRAYLDGRDGAAAIWAEQQFDLLAMGPIHITLQFHLRDDGEGATAWPVVAYIGAQDPESGDAFSVVGQDGAAGWTAYVHDATVAPGIVWVAFGFRSASAEERIHDMDLVEMTLETSSIV